MKKHHIFLLVVCLLLVASLAFPTTETTSKEMSPLFFAKDLSEHPYRITEGTILFMKKDSDEFSASEKKTITHTEILKVVPGGTKAPIPLPYKEQLESVKTDDEDTAEEYIRLPQLAPGNYKLRFSVLHSSGYMPAKKSTSDQELEVVPKSDKEVNKQISEGDDGSF